MAEGELQGFSAGPARVVRAQKEARADVHHPDGSGTSVRTQVGRAIERWLLWLCTWNLRERQRTARPRSLLNGTVFVFGL